MMNETVIKAFGKINLALDVTGRREDGYHLVKMIMQSVGISDEVTIRKNQGGINISCSNPLVPLGQSNIAWKAADKIIQKYKLAGGVDIHIEKNIPMAAGMAGGSADAAAVIKGMNELFDLDMAENEMDEIALKLGADVPFCLRKGTYLSEGIGELLTELASAPQCHVLVVNPPFEVSTATVYKALDSMEAPIHPDVDKAIDKLKCPDIKELASCMGNILQDVTAPDHPMIGKIIDKMVSLGAAGAMMTGSGPTVFGLFTEEDKAQKAKDWFEDNNNCGKVFLTEFVR